jgi:hypothetical protein
VATYRLIRRWASLLHGQQKGPPNGQPFALPVTRAYWPQVQVLPA